MEKINEFESLRGILALGVVYQHTFSLIGHSSFLDLSHINMVYVFMILSGFVIFNLIDLKKESYTLFLIRRILRLYPIYITCLLIALILAPELAPIIITKLEPTAANLLKETISQPLTHLLIHILFLQNIIPKSILPGASHTILSPAWSISIEFHFYLIAPFLYKAIEKIKRNERFIFYTILFIIFTFFIYSNLRYMGQDHIFIYIHLFYMGIFSYYIWKNYQEFNKILNSLNSYFPFIFLLPCILMEPSYTAYAWFIWSIVFCSALTKRYGSTETKSNTICKILNNSIIKFLGKISYSIYLSHMIIMWCVLAVIVKYLPLMEGWALYLLFSIPSITFTLIFSSFLYYTIEKPFISLGQKLKGSLENPTFNNKDATQSLPH